MDRFLPDGMGGGFGGSPTMPRMAPPPGMVPPGAQVIPPPGPPNPTGGGGPFDQWLANQGSGTSPGGGQFGLPGIPYNPMPPGVGGNGGAPQAVPVPQAGAPVTPPSMPGIPPAPMPPGGGGIPGMTSPPTPPQMPGAGAGDPGAYEAGRQFARQILAMRLAGGVR